MKFLALLIICVVAITQAHRGRNGRGGSCQNALQARCASLNQTTFLASPCDIRFPATYNATAYSITPSCS